MSNIVLSPNASGTGNLTIAAPNTNSNRTLTLPDNTGTILTSATTTGFPAGSVLQVVNATYSTSTSTTSTSFVDTGLTATITPSNSTSKILVIVEQNGIGKAAGTTGSGVGLRLLRNGTSVIDSTNGGFSAYIAYTNSSSVNYIGGSSLCYLDSPASASAVVYKTQFKQSDATAASVVVQNNDSISSITLMEIAA